jgi:hypothetical protein
MRILGRTLAGVTGALILATTMAAPAGAAVNKTTPPAPPAAGAPAAPKVKHTLSPLPSGVPTYCHNPRFSYLPQCGGKGRAPAAAPSAVPAPPAKSAPAK